MSEASTPECIVRGIDGRRGTVDFVCERFAGSIVLSESDDGAQIRGCGVDGCSATIKVGGKPEPNRKPWEIIEKIYDGATENCAILKLSESA